ncbi:putative sister chromatid cohesion complex cohesin subunit [Fasciola gigantica]|uniref:Putative sister chromatid cohesion complex cohesin subunit n=1 Tax=Fasciola gigantica TaxID=46835 RepID=A0A504YP96_FASGI|nr:putative sister chromatid cohesion complex cohesin subunit [Fasciola gigantica]
MFYAHFVLSKKGPLARIWLAAHWDKKLTRAHVFETNISSSVEAILEPKLKMALRTSGHLLLGVVRIYSRKAKYLLADCNEAFVKIKMAFRPGVVDLPDEANREAAIAAITLPENIHDFEATIADLNEINMNTIAINQSRPEDITMREDFGEINLGRQDDDFGDSAFDEASSREVLREGDKTFSDGMYRASGQLSVRTGTDFSLRSDQDMDATLIAGDHVDGLRDPDKHPKSGDLAARPDEIGIDDNDFDGGFLPGADDDDENFGGEIDHSLFADAGIFEDPSAQKQLEHLTSEIESHMDTARFGLGETGATPVPQSGEATATEQTQDRQFPRNQQQAQPTASVAQTTTTTSAGGPTAATVEPKLTGLPTVSVTTSRIGMTTIQTDNTTIITNESEAFALPPIDTTSATGAEPKRATKRKRRLIVDEQKSIPSEIMKLQMEDTSDITTQLELAPPTKKLMHWKETGSVDKLFTLPGRAIPSRVLQRLFVRNLHIVSVPDDAPEEQLQPLKVGPVPVGPPISQADQTMTDVSAFDEALIPHVPTSEATHPEFLTSKSPSIPNEVPESQMLGMQKLDAIKEVVEEVAVNQQTSSEHKTSDLDEVHDVIRRDHEEEFSDHAMHDDLAFMGGPETPYLAPPSVLSEAPPSVMQADMLALERELAAADDEAEHEFAAVFGTTEPDANGLIPTGLSSMDTMGQSGMASTETLEERRLEKRSKVLLRMLRVHLQQQGWDESLSLQSICAGNTKKQVSNRFPWSKGKFFVRFQTIVSLAIPLRAIPIHVDRSSRWKN